MYRVYSDLVAAPPSVCHPIPQWPQAAPLSLAEAGQESSTGRGRGYRGAASVFSQLPLSSRIQSFEALQPSSQTQCLQ